MKYAIFILSIAAAAAGAFTVLPVLGYSSSTGFLLGGYLVTQIGSDQPVTMFSVDTYYGTAGVIKFQPALTQVIHQGILNSNLECRKILDKNWFGWGNNTDPDSFATMDIEMVHLTSVYTLPLSENFSVSAGLDARHSSVFNREESYLWERIPGEVFNPTQTAGASAAVTGVFPVPVNGDLLFETQGFFQAGDVSYSGISGRVRLQVRPWEGGELAAGTRLYRHFNVEETPVPYTSGIGAHNDFRGYSDYRFTGGAWVLGQFEARQRILTLKDENGQPALTLAVAGFAEAGRSGENIGELSMDDLHTDAGGGIRIGANQQAMMRMDAGWGDQGMILSTGFNSAF